MIMTNNDDRAVSDHVDIWKFSLVSIMGDEVAELPGREASWGK